MLAAKITGWGKVGLFEASKPKPGPGEILVKLRACGICGTDIEKLTSQTDTPGILGHELVGEIAELGKGVSGFRRGRRVFVHHHVSCGRCYYCLHGDETQCPSFKETNVFPSGFSEFFLVPRLNVERGATVPLPTQLKDEEATFVEPLACCIKALTKVSFDSDSSICVLGTGAMGLLHIKLLRLMGVNRILAVDLLESRRRAALRSGASLASHPDSAKTAANKISEGRKVDVAVTATGSSRAFEQALGLVRNGGSVLVFGAPHKEAAVKIRLGRVFYNEVNVVPSYSTTEPYIRKAMALLEERRISVTDLVTHAFTLKQVKKAFRVAQNSRNSIKVVVKN